VSIAETLKHVSLFAHLDDRAREAAAGLALARRVPAGRILFREDEAADGFYVVLEGKVKVYKLSPDGRQQILHVFGPGQAFAEAAMFAGETFPAWAETLEASRLAFFPRDRIVDGLAENPALAMGMIASLAKLCRQLAGLVGQVTLTDAAGRLARYLTDLARKKGVALEKGASVRLDLPKGELARLLNVAPETLSRAFAGLAERDLVAVDGKVITVRNPAGLAAVATGGAGEGEGA
jgi:CRP/FNR family transcriptional regulator